MQEYYYYDLSAKPSSELSQLLHEINTWKTLDENQKDLKQEIKDILYRRGWIE